MGILDSLGGAFKGVLGQVETEAVPALIPEALGKTNLGNLQGLVNQLQQGGLGAQVQSWLADGENLQITPDQLKAVLNDDQVQQLAQHFGIDPDAVLQLLSEHLPTAVSQAGQQGAVNAGS
jgi:uncharacterized protein YidB (DUF937 family)